MPAIYVNHETGEEFKTKDEAMNAYRNGERVDLYLFSELLQENVMVGYWEV